MARTLWEVHKWNGSAWVDEPGLYKPNSNFELNFTSNQQKIKLANGSNAFVTPETLYIKEDLTFEFLEIYPEDDFYDRIINYIKNQDYLYITTHLGENLGGRFIAIRRVWLLGVADTFDFQVIFQRMD